MIKYIKALASAVFVLVAICIIAQQLQLNSATFRVKPYTPTFKLNPVLKGVQKNSSMGLQVQDGYFPQFQFGSGKLQPYMLIAIPSVLRQGKSYLNATLRYMIEPLTTLQKQNTLFVVYLADNQATVFESQAKQLYDEFREEFEMKMIHLIGPPRELHPNWENKLVPNFNDKMERIRWRSKQNLDMAFLMSYVVRYIDPTFFLMMEDDVQAANNYMSEILKFAEEKPTDTWEYCTFTKVGGAGKLFHYKSTREFAEFVAMFWDAKPLDWLYWDFVRNKRCGYSETAEVCKTKSNMLIRDYKGDLFKHLGKVSSRTSFGIER